MLSLSWDNGSRTEEKVLGSRVLDGERPQVAVQRGRWQSARSLGEWTLVGATADFGFCTVMIMLVEEEG